MRKYMGPYTRAEATELLNEAQNKYDCAYNSPDENYCKEEQCTLFGICEHSRVASSILKDYILLNQKKFTSRKISKVIEELNDACLVPYIIKPLAYHSDLKFLLHEIKTTIDNLDDNDKLNLNDLVLDLCDNIVSKSKKDSEPFSKIPHHFIDHDLRNLTCTELRVLLVIFRHQSFSGKDRNFVGYKTIAEKAKVSFSNVDKPIRELKKKGFLENNPTLEKGGVRKNDWKVNFKVKKQPEE